MLKKAILVPVLLAGLGLAADPGCATVPAPLASPQRVEVRGGELHFVGVGAGDPLVLVHGTLCDFSFWSPHLEALAKGHRVIAYSRRFSWPNENGEPPADFSARQEAQDLAALIDALDLGPVDLVGHSYGALTSLWLCLDRPELVRTLVLAEPPVNPGPLGLPPRDELRDWPRLAELARRGAVREAMGVFVSGVLGPEAVERIPEEVWKQFLRNGSDFRGLVNSTDPFPEISREQLRRISVPVLMVLGQAEVGGAFESASDALVGLIPGAESVTIPRASHNMWEGDAEATLRAILDFLDRWRSPDEVKPDGSGSMDPPG